MSRWLLATGACLLAGLLGGGACADRTSSTSSTPSTPTTPTSPGTAVCAYVPDGAAPAVDAVGGAGAAAVRTAPACKWTAVTGSSADSWIVIDGQGTRLGPGLVAFTLQANRSFSGRTGTLVIKGEGGEILATHAISQRAAGCLYSVTPAAIALPASGTYQFAEDSPVRVSIHAEPSDCQWTATPSVSWIRMVYETPRGTGDKTLYLSVTASNHDPVARFGSVIVAGLSGVNPDAPVIVSQAASR